MTLALVAAAVLQSAVSQVTVFGDRARVVRTAEVPAGVTSVELPLLPDSVDPSSIRVEGNLEVQRIDIAHVEPDAFPVDQARALLGKLERLDDRLALLSAQRDDYAFHLGELRKIAPQLPPDSLKPRPRLNPRGWSASLAFQREGLRQADARSRELQQQLDDLSRERERLAAQARLVGGAKRRSGFRVTAWLAGVHAGRLALSYLVGSARWTPGYDLQLLKDQKSVRVAFSGAVSQETGEDWDDADLILSTAMPATARTLPEIATWKIGDRERFVPQSRRTNAPAPPPRLPSPPPPAPAADANPGLREELLRRAQSDPSPGPAPVNALGGGASPAMAKQFAAAPPPASAAGQAEPGEDAGATTAPPAWEAADDVREPAPLARAAPQSFVAKEELGTTGSRVRRKDLREEPGDEGLGISPPPSWLPPRPPPGSPADAAGGYELEYGTLRPETIRSGGGARRVLLVSESWPVAAERVAWPGVGTDVYLTARIKSRSARILPRAQARLAVGDDLAGTAVVPLSRPEMEFELPLGVDRAIHPQRNVAQVKGEEGVFSKDDVTRYLVTIEIANPYPVPIAMRVIDQYPLTGDNHMEVELIEAPRAEIDRTSGKLTWALEVAPAATLKLGFIYQLKRPRGFRVHQ